MMPRSIVLLALGCTAEPPPPTDTDPQGTAPTQPTGPQGEPCSVLQVFDGDVAASDSLDFCLSFNVVGGDLIVDDELTSLQCLCEVQGDLRFTDVRGRLDFPNLASVGGTVEIVYQSGLTHLDLPVLTSIGGDLLAQEADTLSTLTVPLLAAVTNVTLVETDLDTFAVPLVIEVQAVTVSDNAALQTFTFGAVESVDQLVFDGNAQLEAVAGVADLATIGGDLLVTNNIDLESLEGFDTLRSIGGAFTVIDNETLAFIGGFDALTSVGGTLTLDDLPRLAEIDAFHGLETVGGDVVIEGAELLTVLAGFEELESCGTFALRSLAVLDPLPAMPALTQITGLEMIDLGRALKLGAAPSLTSVDGDVLVQQNALLRTLDDLTALTSIAGTLSVEGNGSLMDVAALHTLEWVGGDVLVRNNPALGSPAADALVAAIDQIDGKIAVTGN